MGISTPDSRVNVLLRLVGALFFALGAILAYFTHVEASAATIASQIAPVFYLGAGLLMIVGFVAFFAKYK